MPLHVKVSRPPVRRSVCFDLENKPLAYWYDGEATSQITAFGWKWDGERKVSTLLLQADGSFVNDEGVALGVEAAYSTFVDALASAGIVYGHNIRRHDLPMLNAGLLRLRLPPLPPLWTSDTCKDLPKRAGLSYSLENLAAMYELPGKKLAMTQPDWEAANRLTPGGIEKARKRVTADVVLQARLRAKLIELGLLKPERAWRP